MLPKPKFTIHATWIHNVVLDLWVCDPRLPSDSSMVIEAGCRAIEFAVDLIKQKGGTVSSEIIIMDAWFNRFWIWRGWGENTTDETQTFQRVLCKYFGDIWGPEPSTTKLPLDQLAQNLRQITA